MTRKHFIALAEMMHTIRSQPETIRSIEARVLWNTTVIELANVCHKFSDGFKRDRFVMACGNLFTFGTSKASGGRSETHSQTIP